MTNRALIFVESSTSGHLFVRAARSQGFQPILVTTRSDRYGNLAGEPVGIVLADSFNMRRGLHMGIREYLVHLAPSDVILDKADERQTGKILSRDFGFRGQRMPGR